MAERVMMPKGKHLSPEEFDAFMRDRALERLRNMPKGEKGFVVGCYWNIYFSDNELVECSICEIPLYVRPWVRLIAEQNEFDILCEFCASELNGKLFAETATQDLDAVIKYTGESKPK